MLKKNRLNLAVAAAMGLGAAVGLPQLASAQEEPLLEEVIVTGSRIARTNFDTGAQIVSMDRQQIDALGLPSVADVLRSSPLNAMGSINPQSGSSAQSNANIDLRGLGAERTLVMINGRRMTGSPSQGAGAININMIPMAAVERMDILADGGSAVYGSDAVAGVVNLMMRENFDGLEFKITRGERSEDDGHEEGMSIIGGASSDRGNVTFALEYSKLSPVFDADRDYTAPRASDTDGNGVIDAYVDTDGYSIYGKSVAIYDPNTGYDNILAAKDCPSDGAWLGEVDSDQDWFPSQPGSTYCMFGYGNTSANKASLDKINTYLSYNYEINDHVEVFGTALFSRVESFGRYAPAADVWPDMSPDYEHNPHDIDQLLADGLITESMDPETGEMVPNYDITGYYRWTNVGTRDGEVTDTQWDFTLGARGDINDNFNYEAYYQKSHYDVKDLGYYYLSYTGLDYVLANGIDPFSEEGQGAMSAVAIQDNYSDMDKFYGHVQFGLGDLFGAGEILALAGAEYFEVDYQNLYDRQSEAGLVGGSAGNSSSGERDVTAVFAEAILPVTDSIEVNAAIRYDDYSDFGSEVSPSLSAIWGITDSISVRGRWSSGFRAPDLDQLYGPETFSAETATDFTRCALGGVAPEDCSSGQVDTYYSTNEDLDAETSETFSIGGNWEFVQNWEVDLTYWMIEVEDVIVQSDTQDVLNAESAGVDMPSNSDTWVDRTTARPVVYSSYTNQGELNVEGLDLKLAGLVETSFGMFTLDTLVSHTLEYEEAAFYKGDNVDKAGFYLYPDLKAQMVLGWTMGRHSVSYVLDYISEHAAANSVVGAGTASATLEASSDDLDSWTTHNIAYTFNADEWGAVKIGARNFTNEEPVLDSSGKFNDDLYDFYDNTGRVYYAEYTITF